MAAYPNVLFIMTDELRATALKLYSDLGIETPNIENLANTGVRFEHAVTPHPLCVPARVAMMSSRYPHSTGSRRNETLMPENELHAFKIWKDLGYTTGLIGKNHCYSHKSDLELIDVRCEISHMGLTREHYGGGNLGTTGMEWEIPEEIITQSHSTRASMNDTTGAGEYEITDHPIEGYSTRAIAVQVKGFLEKFSQGNTFGSKNTNGSFALQVSFPDPHHPNEIHKDIFASIDPDSIKIPPYKSDEFTNANVPERNKITYEMLNLDNFEESDIRKMISVYYSMTKFIDDAIGEIIQTLEDLDLRKNTIIIFTSDHGDFAGEHNMFGKAGVFYDSLIRVPCIISWPNGGVPEGIVDKSLVNTIDILPTILELSGICDFSPSKQILNKYIPYEGPQLLIDKDMTSFTSESFRRIQGKPMPSVTKTSPRLAAYSEYGAGGPLLTSEIFNTLPVKSGPKAVMNSLRAREAEGRRKMVRTAKWKYITDTSTSKKYHLSKAKIDDELYDLQNDPHELLNVAYDPENSPIISEMRELLLDWMIETEDVNPVALPDRMSRDVDFI